MGGLGILRTQEDTYEGEFSNGNKHGKGVVLLPGGRRHKEEWENGSRLESLTVLQDTGFPNKQLGTLVRSGTKFPLPPIPSTSVSDWVDKARALDVSSLSDVYKHVNS